MQDALEIFASRFTPPGSVPGGVDGFVSEICIPSLTGAADAFLALAMATNSIGGKSGDERRRPRIVLAITPGLPDADRLADDLRVLTSQPSPNSKGKSRAANAAPDAYQTRVLEFPPLLGDDKSSLGVRLKTIAALKAWGLSPYPCVVVASLPGLAIPIPTKSIPSLHLGTDPASLGTDPMSFGDICKKLPEMGYNRVPQVEQEGDFSVRGGIVDAWSPGDEFPVRAEFFGDELESIRSFNPATQISISRIDNAELLPVATGDRPQGIVGTDPASSGTDPERRQSLISILPENAAILAIEHNEYSLSQVLPERTPLTSGDRPQAGGDRPQGVAGRFTIYTGDPAPSGVATYGFQTAPLPGFAELGADEAHHPELFDAARKRLDQHISAAERRGAAILRLDGLSGGFELDGALLVVTKADRVFTKKKEHVPRNAAVMRGPRLSDFDDLEPGEYVVHVDYGVGRYIGSSEILFDGRRSEVFTIEYADGGKLHVPAAHAHLLSRYVGVKGEAVRLHRLDGKRWEKDKKDAQKAVSDLAAALLETQAKRETTPGTAYDVACEGRDAFDAAFPYEETPDQLAAIAAVDKDLASRKPMDRLVCGDAGYGKTEVAMRAAFVVAMNGRQVAVLAPTTVLAEQHFETFTSRFDGTPIRIESVSRFQSGGTHDGTFKRLEAGVCDIVIGTHAILNPRIRFRDLGLVIIDEEQRFGVRHKEFLKRLRATADVLTLSATPIPRTLYLSMTGARDLSLLRSPPSARVAVDTRIVRDSDETVAAAVESELARGGQVFFLHNRVMTIGKVERRLKSLCPRARVVVAHGQMDARALAKKMRDFERGKYDILLSTTIIESGIDIPRANTILVDRADTFGMADLYQLRGRVGRSSRQGYAYFLLPPSGDIDSDARERLKALKRHGGLGAGFNLAVRDLELRGAGNLLGSQQSGHIAAVGFGLYCQLLKRTIAMLKGERVKEVVDVKLNLDFANPRIPTEYIEEDAQRMSLLKRYAEAQDLSAVRALAAEMKDRFGPPPPEVDEYVRVAELRVRCAMAGISHIDARGTRAVLYKAGSSEIYKVVDIPGKTPRRKLSELTAAVAGL